jgi:phosphonate transport system substrate-binding protein
MIAPQAAPWSPTEGQPLIRPIKPGLGLWLVLILAVSLVWGNHKVFTELVDIRHISAPMPGNLSPSAFQPDNQDQVVVRIGVVSRFAPNIIYRLYQPIMDYLNAHSENHHELALSESYQDAARSLQMGEVQASFLGAWMCHQLPEDSGLIPVAMPVNAQGFSRFHVVLITAQDSPIHSMADLKGRRIAVPSDQAFSGNWLQNHGLKTAGLAVGDLDTLQHFQHHETVVWQVLRGNFQAGVVKENLAQRYRSRGLRTVALSPAIAGPPLVVSENNQNEEVQELVQLLLALDRNNAQDLALMKSWTPEFAFGFRPVENRTYKEDFLQSATGTGASP